jgi:NAD(P)-dependent dehydrogenase (short-subunit alcohol dehydrogenase family)
VTAGYAATKAVIVGYAKGAARNLGARKITVTVVQADVMATDMAAGLSASRPEEVSQPKSRFLRSGEPRFLKAFK